MEVEHLYSLSRKVSELPILGGLHERVRKRFSWLAPVLMSINYPYTYEVFVSSRFLLSVFISLAAVPILFLLHRVAFGLSHSTNILLSFAVALIVGVVAFNAQMIFPYLKRSMIKLSIQSYLPYTLMIMSLYAAGGYQTFTIIQKTANIMKERNTREVLERIVTDVVRGESIEDKLLYEAVNCPSPDLGNVLEGLASTSLSGIGTLSLLKNSLDNYLKRLDSKLREKIDKIGVIMEGYIVIGVLFPLLLEVILLFFANQVRIQVPPEVIIVALFFIALPVFFIVTVIILDSILSEVMF